jgi:hypothetical protein
LTDFYLYAIILINVQSTIKNKNSTRIHWWFSNDKLRILTWIIVKKKIFNVMYLMMSIIIIIVMFINLFYVQSDGITPALSLFLSWLWIWICSDVFLQAEHFHTIISLQLLQVISGTKTLPQNLHDSLLNIHSHQYLTWKSKPQHNND